jgi:hypothetical protein
MINSHQKVGETPNLETFYMSNIPKHSKHNIRCSNISDESTTDTNLFENIKIS